LREDLITIGDHSLTKKQKHRLLVERMVQNMKSLEKTAHDVAPEEKQWMRSVRRKQWVNSSSNFLSNSEVGKLNYDRETHEII